MEGAAGGRQGTHCTGRGLAQAWHRVAAASPAAVHATSVLPDGRPRGSRASSVAPLASAAAGSSFSAGT